MAIVAASVETNGWVLRLDVEAAPGTFLAYTLDPDGSPRVVLTSDHAGFAPSGGQAVATTRNRTLVGTKPLRVAAEVVGVTLQPFRIDETDLGGGIVRVRIALSEHVYATDTNLRLAVAAGWRTGEAAASSIVVTNNSTIVAPIPIMRWVLPQLSVVTGNVRVSLMVVSHHPNGFQPVAGVKFTVTDGTTTKTAWTTALATDNSMGDNLRCYTLEIDPATATALTAGLLRCDAEVYPWLGSMRPTDTAGTRSMATLRADARSVNAAAPYVVGYDPAGTRYGAMFAYVDPVNGTVTAAAGMVQTTLAGAKAVAPASRPRDINTALQAGFLFNRTLAAANGQAAVTRSIDGMRIVLAPGTHPDGAGSTAVNFGVNTVEIPVRIIGDPDDSNPRANCILQVATARVINRAQRVLLQQLTWEIGGATMMGSTQELILIDDCIVRGKAGFETNLLAPYAGSLPAVGTYNLAITRTRWWRNGSEISNGNQRLSLLRACEHSRYVTVFLCAVRNRVIPPSEDTTLTGTQANTAFRGWLSPTLPGQAEDMILAGNDIRSWGGRIWAESPLPAATAGTVSDSVRRFAMVGNVCERIGASPEALYAIGENTLRTMSYNIIEGNTFVGERANTFYSDPPATTLAEVNTALNHAFVNRVAGNIFDWLPTKHDDFLDAETAATRAANGQAANPYRPQMTAAWSMLYGVGHEANVDMSRTASAPNFPLQYSGRRSLTGYGGALAPGYADDRSKLGSGGGGGDYTPGAASPAVNRVVSGQSDVDFRGMARPALADAGCFQAMTLALGPAGARSGMIAQSPSIAWSGDLVPPANAHAHRTAAPTIGWSADIAAASTVSSQRGTSTDLALAFGLVPAAATVAVETTDTALLSSGTALTVTPTSARMLATDMATLLLPAGLSVRATVTVAADPRSLIPNRN
jgi:hypothetical protein